MVLSWQYKVRNGLGREQGGEVGWDGNINSSPDSQAAVLDWERSLFPSFRTKGDIECLPGLLSGPCQTFPEPLFPAMWVLSLTSIEAWVAGSNFSKGTGCYVFLCAVGFLGVSQGILSCPQYTPLYPQQPMGFLKGKLFAVEQP